MRCALWPSRSADEHRTAIHKFLTGVAREPSAVLVASDRTGNPVGFIELSIRPYAEGCTTDHVGYVEGWYVEPPARRQGFGRDLMNAAEAWARDQGCEELASDSEVANEVSQLVHRGVGFEVVGQIMCFRKAL